MEKHQIEVLKKQIQDCIDLLDSFKESSKCSHEIFQFPTGAKVDVMHDKFGIPSTLFYTLPPGLPIFEKGTNRILVTDSQSELYDFSFWLHDLFVRT